MAFVICPRCGSQIRRQVCAQCGHKLDAAAAAGIAVSGAAAAIPVAHLRWSVLKQIFSQTLKRHTPSQAEAKFAAISGSQASRSELWPTPWLCWRIFILLLGGFLILLLALRYSSNPFLIPGVILLGAFAVPVSQSIFFLEANTPGNISFYAFMRFFVTGAILSLVFTVLLYELGEDALANLGASSAALVEEPAKLIAVVVLARSMGTRWTLNGLALGAAVGAGFASFETSGYALVALIQPDGSLESMQEILVLRAWSSLGGHVVWTAVAAAALWSVNKGGPFSLEMVFQIRFLLPFATVVGLHFVWNSNWAVEAGNLAYVGLVVLGVSLALGFLIRGAKEYASSAKRSPWEPTIADARLMGRGAADAGGESSRRDAARPSSTSRPAPSDPDPLDFLAD